MINLKSLIILIIISIFNSNLSMERGFSIIGKMSQEILLCMSECIDNISLSVEDIDMQDSGGNTPLMRFIIAKSNIMKNNTVEVTEGYLIKDLLNIYDNLIDRYISIKANLDHKNHLGKTTLLLAIENDLIDIAHSLVENGADINIEDNEGNTAIEVVKGRSDYRLSRFFKKHKFTED